MYFLSINAEMGETIVNQQKNAVFLFQLSKFIKQGGRTFSTRIVFSESIPLATELAFTMLLGKPEPPPTGLF